MGAFVQIIEFKTDKLDEFRALEDEMREANGSQRFTASVVGRDREKPDSYVVMVEFPSYDAARENNQDPVTQRFAAKMSELASSKPIFRNLDVVDRRP